MRLLPLGLVNQLHDARQYRFVGFFRDAQFEIPVFVNGAGKCHVAHRLDHRHTLPGEGGLIYRRNATNDGAV